MTSPEQLYTRLVAAFQHGQWQEAQNLANQLLPSAPQHAGVYGMAGVTCMELQQFAQAEPYLRRATELDPARADFATLHAKSLAANQMPTAATAAADRALSLSPTDPATLDVLGVVYTQAGANERAICAFRDAVSLAPEHASYRLNLATALISNGDLATAENELEACIRLNPKYWHAHLLLSQLRRQTPACHHLDRLHELLSQNQADTAACTYLNLALSKEYEDLGDYTRAFDHLARGKSAEHVQRPYSIQRDETLFKALMHAFPAPQAVVPLGGPIDGGPIFVLGMPRSGTTLVERILSNHPDVHAAGELQNFGMALQHATGSRGSFLFDPDITRRTRHIDWKRLGSIYLASTRFLTAGKPYFIDKLPHNFLHVGYIAQALPNARIICVRRNPMDTCLGNFRQLFSRTSLHFDYSCDLLDTGRYYILFDRLMAHWRRIFPDRILEVGYEDLVDSPEPQIRQLLDFCGLPWHDACLHPESNPAPVATFSAMQVRSRFDPSGIRRWKKYESQLSELRALLIGAGVTIA
ncbi:sulfotransferase [Rhodanobacter sp. B04]|uniref:tetratricopeptide repeat-containing sulfotransferase family protein n=1 Tax=Rhodanobacter sp. B04 TaxID=1945860 RepID=UPI000987886B|nr:tetratricopeptide repeat-containing sulfotransferase family protein [Rhodanobacter sp. B04]OOG65489.1 sulfotransferase [Rhodanobacter sp. B04]